MTKGGSFIIKTIFFFFECLETFNSCLCFCRIVQSVQNLVFTGYTCSKYSKNSIVFTLFYWKINKKGFISNWWCHLWSRSVTATSISAPIGKPTYYLIKIVYAKRSRPPFLSVSADFLSSRTTQKKIKWRVSNLSKRKKKKNVRKFYATYKSVDFVWTKPDHSPTSMIKASKTPSNLYHYLCRLWPVSLSRFVNELM